MPTMLEQLDAALRAGSTEILVAPDVYEALKTAASTSGMVEEANQFLSTKIRVSRFVPSGTILGLPKGGMTLPPLGSPLGIPKPHSDAADSLAYANMVYALNTPKPTGEPKLTVLKARDPYKQIAYIEPISCDAYRSDGQFILKLTPEGADELIRLNPHIVWKSTGSS